MSNLQRGEDLKHFYQTSSHRKVILQIKRDKTFNYIRYEILSWKISNLVIIPYKVVNERFITLRLTLHTWYYHKVNVHRLRVRKV